MALGPLSARDRQDRYKTGLLRYDEAQPLTSGQQERARDNIAASGRALAAPEANGLMSAADKQVLDAAGEGTQAELNAGAEVIRRLWSASMLWSWFQNRTRFLFNANNAAPLFAVRAWATFTASGSVAQSGNIASVSRLGTGRWRINFETNMPVAGFAISGAAIQDAGGSSPPIAITLEEGSRSVSGVIVQARYSTSGSQGLTDPSSVSVLVVC